MTMEKSSSPLSQRSSPPPSNQADLPELPHWFISAFAGACVFIIIVTAVLLVVQWPQSVTWVEEWLRRLQTRPRKKLRQELGNENVRRNECSYDVTRPSHLAGESNDECVQVHDWVHRGHGRKHKGKFGVGSVAESRGLGITIAGVEDISNASDLGWPRSGPSKTAPAGPPCKTAPLSPVRPWPSGSSLHHNAQEAAHTVEGQPLHTPLHLHEPSQVDISNATEKVTVLNPIVCKIGKVIFDGLYWLAEEVHDPFQDHESGLLLTIREDEREDGIDDGR